MSFIRCVYMQLVMEEVDRLQLELQNTIAMYKQVCEELAHAQSKVRVLIMYGVSFVCKRKYIQKASLQIIC